MAVHSINEREAKKQLDQLLEWVDQGEEVIIQREDKPSVRLVSELKKTKKRTFGQHQGKAWISEDFNDPLPESFWLGES